MPGRAAQREGTVGALRDGGLGCEGDLRGAVGRLPGAGGDRRATVETVITQLAVQAGGHHAAQGAGGPGVGQQVTVLAVFGPALPGALEEVQIVAAMNALQRRQAEILRCLHRSQFPRLDPLQHVVGTRGHFKAGHQLPVHQFTTAVVQVVIVRVDRQHFCSPQAVSVHAVLRRARFMRTSGEAKRGSMWPICVSVIRPALGRHARNWLGVTPLQRTKACLKLAVSLNPSVSAIRWIGHRFSANNCLARSKRNSSSSS